MLLFLILFLHFSKKHEVSNREGKDVSCEMKKIIAAWAADTDALFSVPMTAPADYVESDDEEMSLTFYEPQTSKTKERC